MDGIYQFKKKLVFHPNLSYTLFSCKKSIFNDILYLIHKKTHKNEVKFSEFGITKFNLIVFTISQWDLVLQLSILKFLKFVYNKVSEGGLLC